MKQELKSKTRRSFLRARKIDLNLRGRNGGQAVVEYILIVSIAVGMIFIMKGAFSGMNKFINNYLGLYTECLMAHGELPALGVSDGSTFSDGSGLKEHLTSDYKCESGFKPFTLAGGRPPVGGGSLNGSQASRNAAAKSGANADNNSSNSSSGSKGNSSKNSDKDKDAVGSNSGSSSPYDEGKIKRSGRSTADGFAGAGSDRSRIIEDDSEGDEEGGRGRKRRPRESRTIYRDRTRYKALIGLEAEQITNQSSRSSIKRKPTSRSIAKADGGSFNGPRSGLMKPPPDRIVVAAEIKEEGWGFGKMLKWLLIIGILVALIIFFGGQLMNYSNSDS